MNHEEFMEWLDSNGACHKAIAWVAEHRADAATAWQQCERGDWLLWWVEMLHPITEMPIDEIADMGIAEPYRETYWQHGNVRSATPAEHQAAADAVRAAVDFGGILEARGGTSDE